MTLQHQLSMIKCHSSSTYTLGQHVVYKTQWLL